MKSFENPSWREVQSLEINDGGLETTLVAVSKIHGCTYEECHLFFTEGGEFPMGEGRYVRQVTHNVRPQGADSQLF